jgi:hypothetical protein
MDGLYAVMAIDPGGSTGVAWGVFHDDAETVQEAISGKFCTGQRTYEGYPRQQVNDICRLWRRLYMEWVFGLGIAPEDCHMVIEDIIISPTTPPGKDVKQAIEIGRGIYYYRLGSAHEHERWNCGWVPPVRVSWQTPAQASSFARKERLKDWGVWIRGKEHERSAWKHIALYVARHMEARRAASRARRRVRATRARAQ